MKTQEQDYTQKKKKKINANTIIMSRAKNWNLQNYIKLKEKN